MSPGATGLPAHVDAAVHHPDAMRALRAELSRSAAAVLVLQSAVWPELLDGRPAQHVDAVEARVVGVEVSEAVDLAVARSRAAAAMLGGEPPAGRAWVLILDANQRVAVLSLARTSAPSTGLPRASRGGDA